MNFGFYSYLSAGLAFTLFTLLLVFSWRQSYRSRVLAAVAVIHAIWAYLAAGYAGGSLNTFGVYHILEVLRYVAWYYFFLKLLAPQAGGEAQVLQRALNLSMVFALLVLITELALFLFSDSFRTVDVISMSNVSHIFLAIIGLAAIEQLYRNTSRQYRWNVKYLFIGTGGIFAFDLYLYSQALLFQGLDRELWEARGIVNLILVPLLVMTAARNRDWATNMFVSRQIVLGTTAILGAGVYLILMAIAGIYIREFGGSWGRFAQISFFSLALVLLPAVMLSGQLRARTRVFLGKHFYRNKYDYRNEWLRLTRELDDSRKRKNEFEAVIQVFANIVEARSGLLWMAGQQQQLENVAAWNASRVRENLSPDSQLVRFLNDTGFIINLLELESHSDEYGHLSLPAWLETLSQRWLVIPLTGMDSLLGFVVLAKPLVVRSMNWEDRDLLKTAARQVASYLTVVRTSEALSEARQFEVFNRLSAYMVHDLKNIAAELQLIARNADKHRHNPEFLEDAFETVRNAASDIGRLLDQLRGKQIQGEKKVRIDLCALVHEAIDRSSGRAPVPVLEARCEAAPALAEKDRLVNVLMHLFENAQQATADDGFVKVSVLEGRPAHVIRIRDNGCGMDEAFIQKRLFTPFDTTRGNAGMGIGMYESREYIHQLGGKMQVASEPGKGTQIELHIPSVQDDNDD